MFRHFILNDLSLQALYIASQRQAFLVVALELLLDAQEILLGVGPNLSACPCAYVVFHLFPIFPILEYS